MIDWVAFADVTSFFPPYNATFSVLGHTFKTGSAVHMHATRVANRRNGFSLCYCCECRRSL